MKENNFEKAIELFHEDALQENILNAFDVLVSAIAIWNPGLAFVFSTFSSVLKIGVNSISRIKAEKNIRRIVDAVKIVYKKLQTGEANYEAVLICPELFRNALIFNDEERVEEHLALIEELFSSGKYDFDRLTETLRLVNQLSSIEYKILKLIPPDNTKWKDILKEETILHLFETQPQRLTAAFLSLIGMNLVVRKLRIQHNAGPELGTIDYDNDVEYIRLSDYGQLFLGIMKEIKARQDSKDSMQSNIA